MVRLQFCIVLCLTIVLCHSASAQNLKALLDKGDKQLARKDYAEALQTYLEALKLGPDDAGTNFRVGVSYLHGELKAKAVPYLEKAYRLNPEVDLDIDYHLGMAYQNDH